MPENKLSSAPLKPHTHLKKLWPFFVKHWPAATLGLVIVLFASLLSYPQPMIMRFLIDRVFLGRQFNAFGYAVLLYATIKIFEALLGVVQRVYFTRFEQKIILDIQHDLYNRVLRFPKSFFDTQETGYLMSRLSNDVQGLRWFFSMTITSILSNAFKFAAGVVFLFYLEWRVAAATLIVLPLLALSVKFFSEKTYILSHAAYERSAQVSRKLQESLSAIPLIKAFANEKREIAQLMQETKESQSLALESTVVSSIAGLSTSTLRELSRLLTLIFGGLLIIRGEWTVGSLIAFQSYLNFAYDPANFFAQVNLSLQNSLAALSRIAAFYDVLPEAANPNGLRPAQLQGKIEFRQVSFSYDGEENTLENLSFTIQPREHVAIIGRSGVGKTTLISLILAFYKPGAGEIYFDDQPIGAFALEALRNRIGYVSQSPRLLSGTLFENLRYGMANASEAEIIQAARIAGIHDFIESLPQKYHTLLGENGVNLSEGQKQRLSLARALAKKPDILIFDEPTASLDTETEKKFWDALQQSLLPKTIITITHRPTNLFKPDHTFALENKQLASIKENAKSIDSNTP
ncbi:MAG: ABC transporter ATP-binding protein [Candidatus Margulisiibacteriota bacterium]